MSLKTKILYALCCCAFSLPAFAAAPENVSIIRLIADPAAYHNKAVQVVGVGTFAKESLT